jgi:hypothetical protein
VEAPYLLESAINTYEEITTGVKLQVIYPLKPTPIPIKTHTHTHQNPHTYPLINIKTHPCPHPLGTVAAHGQHETVFQEAARGTFNTSIIYYL